MTRYRIKNRKGIIPAGGRPARKRFKPLTENMHSDVNEILQVVVDDYVHGENTTSVYEDGKGGIEWITTWFVYNSPWEMALYLFRISLDDNSIVIEGEFPVLVPGLHQFKKVCELVEDWNRRPRIQASAGRFLIKQEGIVVFHYEKTCTEGVDEDLIRGSVLDVGIVMDDVYRELIATIFGQSFFFKIS